MIVLKFLVCLLFIIKVISQNSLCNLKIADNKFSVAFKDNDIIFNNGKINDKYRESNSVSPYIASMLKDIDYIYAMQMHDHDPSIPHIQDKIVLINFNNYLIIAS